MRRRDLIAATAVSGFFPAPFIRSASAQSRNDTLLTVTETGPNSLDMHTPGSNISCYEVGWNTYDRLTTFGVTSGTHGEARYDPEKILPELAESWDVSDMSLTFKLKRNAKFHDGTPVTANDVKWSFARALAVGGSPTSQMKAGSMEKPEQFVAVDDHTFRVDFIRKDRLMAPDLCVPTICVMNSQLAKQHATEKDPWALDYTKTNTAGSGAYIVEKWTPGQEVVYHRNNDWAGGALPKIERVIWRMVPSAGNRRALLERGDADISFNMPPRDVAEMDAQKKLTVTGTPADNTMVYLDMNVTMPPFNNLKVRQAVAHAVPYQKIMDAAMFNRGVPMYGGPGTVTTPKWPQPSPFNTDMAKAKALLTEAGFPQGFETTLSFDLGNAVTNEPICVLIQEALGQIGIKLTLNKVPGANWRGEMAKKSFPMLVGLFGGWLNFPEYYFFLNFRGDNPLYDTMSYVNPEMDKFIDGARFEADPQKYRDDIEGFIRLSFADVPRVNLFQPSVDVAMQKNVTGYRYWFHRMLDYRPLAKA